nr:ATP synthase F0 subunit 8 [Ptilometra sp. DH-R]
MPQLDVFWWGFNFVFCWLFFFVLYLYLTSFKLNFFFDGLNNNFDLSSSLGVFNFWLW